MADGERAGLRELVARGRAHYQTGEYAEADGLLHRGAAREGALRRRLRHAGRHLSPGGAAGGGRGDVQRGAAHQPGVHRGGAEPGRHLQRPGQVRRGEGGLRARDGDVEARAARAGSVRQGKDRQHARRHRRRVPRGRRCTRRRCANTSARWRSARRSSTSAPSSATRAARWATSTGAIRELERVRAESPRFVAGRLKLGLVLLRGRRGARTPPPSGAPCWRPSPSNRAAQDVPRAARPGGRAGRASRRETDGERRAPCSPSRRRPIGSSSRRSPPTRPSAKATHTFLWMEKRGLTTFDAIALRRGGVRRRVARRRLRRA